MKLTVLGGGGVRAPLLMPALARRQDALNLRQVVLMDADERKLSLIAPLARFNAQRHGATFQVDWTTDPREALNGADVVITTVRVGGEGGRVEDERIAFEHGVLGQETTGAGGFAMALRTVPILLEYAALMQQLCPDAWLMNFTNPAGLAVQALTERFPDMKIAGICDTPSGMRLQVAAAYGKRGREVPVTFFGLNHLSWMSEAWVDGRNVIPELVADPDAARRVPELRFFEASLLRLLGVFPNEYLYYYYYRERALGNIQKAGETRGEQVQRLGAELLRDLAEIDPEQRPERGWERYEAYIQERHGTYMAMETGQEERQESERAEHAPEPEAGEGYAGVALDILTAQPGSDATMVVNVPNRGAIAGMADDDVVEIATRRTENGVQPCPVGEVPPDELLLMQTVKRYERLTVAAMHERSKALATEALLVHPLVGSYSIAQQLVDAYLRAHADYVGEWK